MNFIEKWIFKGIDSTPHKEYIPKVKWWCYVNNRLLGIVETNPPTQGDKLWLTGKFHTKYSDRFQAHKALDESFRSAIDLNKHCTATMHQRNIRS
jgi:hypothetical protein